MSMFRIKPLVVAITLLGASSAYAVNTGTIDQTGVSNTGVITQSNTFPGDQDATIETIGNNNSATVLQRNAPSSDTADIFQRGNRNTALIDQDGVSFRAFDNTTSIRQVDVSDSNATIDQSTGVDKSMGDILQRNGRFNDALITQGNRPGFDRHTATITQNGSVNSADAYQRGRFHDSTILQRGNFNDAKTLQRGWNQDAWVTQVGNRNEADVLQRNAGGSGSHDATVRQIGRYNMADVDQLGSRHEADILQRANGTSLDPNMATVMQTGSDHSATVRQFIGRGNEATVTQSGAGNTGAITQMGSYNSGTVTQL